MELVSRRICNIKTTQMLWVKDLALLLKIDRWAQTFNLPLNNSLYIFKCWCSLHATSYPVSSSDVLGVPRLVFTQYVASDICWDMKVLFIISIVILVSVIIISCLSRYSSLSDCNPIIPLTQCSPLCPFSPFLSLSYLSP